MLCGAPASAYSFQQEVFSAVIDEARAMLEQQWLESGEEGVGAFKLAEEKYNAMSAANFLRIVTVRHQGLLIGYASVFIFTGMHAAAKALVSDALYLLPAYRRPGVTMRLIKYVEVMAQNEEVAVVHWQANTRFPGFGRLLTFMGYPAISSTHAKVMSYAA